MSDTSQPEFVSNQGKYMFEHADEQKNVQKCCLNIGETIVFDLCTDLWTNGMHSDGFQTVLPHTPCPPQGLGGRLGRESMGYLRVQLQNGLKTGVSSENRRCKWFEHRGPPGAPAPGSQGGVVETF